MKVKELIERLQKAEPNAEIWITFIEDGYQEVTTDKLNVEEHWDTAYGHTVEFKTF